MKDLDRPLLAVTAALIAIGLFALYIAVRSETPSGVHNPDFQKQSLWILIGTIAMVVVARVPLSTLSGNAYVFFVIGVVLLMITVLVAPPIRGARSWIVVGSVRIQPSELFKPFCALALATLLADRRIKKIPALGIPLAAAVVLFPMGLVLLQPDLGTAVSYGALLVGVPYVAGLPVRYIGFAFAAVAAFAGRIIIGVAQDELNHLPTAVALPFTDPRAGAILLAVVGITILILMIVTHRRKLPVPSSWMIGWFLTAVAYFASFPIEGELKKYQRLRLIAFIAPESDPRGASYNVLQSMIAVGSGGLSGRGITGASQTALGFLPERQTDFIFSAISETFGFAGAIVTLGLYAFMLYRIIEIGLHAASEAAAFCAAGVGSVLFFHMVINIGMTLGLVPVIGIPLPLLSYGGSSMVSTLIALGLVQAVALERRRAIYGDTLWEKKKRRPT